MIKEKISLYYAKLRKGLKLVDLKKLILAFKAFNLKKLLKQVKSFDYRRLPSRLKSYNYKGLFSRIRSFDFKGVLRRVSFFDFKAYSEYRKASPSFKLADCKRFIERRKLKIYLYAILFLFIFSHIRGYAIKRLRSRVFPRPVHVAATIKKDVPIYIDSFGTMDAHYNVDIIAQVTGKLKEVHYKSGAEVKKGELLFTIDPSEYKAALEKARATLAEDSADLRLKKETLERNRMLFEKKLISQQEFDNYQTDVSMAEAKLEMNNANLELARINLEYCYIDAPISGVTNKHQLDAGNIVTANSGSALTNIKTIDNLHAYFTVPEKFLPKIRKAMSHAKLKVLVIPQGDDKTSYSGEVDFINNEVDNETGTITIRATIPNEGRALWPGQFVTVRLILGTEKDAVLVPYEAVSLGQKGSYLFVVTSDNKADLRIINTGGMEGDNIVVKKGVAFGESVVTAGQLGLSPGIPVIDVAKPESKKDSCIKRFIKAIKSAIWK